MALAIYFFCFLTVCSSEKACGQAFILIISVYHHGFSFTRLGLCLEHKVGILAAQKSNVSECFNKHLLCIQLKRQ